MYARVSVRVGIVTLGVLAGWIGSQVYPPRTSVVFSQGDDEGMKPVQGRTANEAASDESLLPTDEETEQVLKDLRQWQAERRYRR